MRGRLRRRGLACAILSSSLVFVATVGAPAALKPGVAAADPMPTVTFNFTGGAQLWTVPTAVTAVTIQAWGAGGCGTSVYSASAKGGYVSATIPVIGGQTLYVYVGGGATGTPGGFNGGGAGGLYGQGGGGASDVREGGNSLQNRVLVAGGAGGSCYSQWGAPFGHGGGIAGEVGASCPNGWAGGGGTSNAGGAAGNNSSSIVPPTAGGLGYGGTGGGGPDTTLIGGGGGGGGYYGGGGGGDGWSDDWGNSGVNCGGGGGSGYIEPTATNVAEVQGGNATSGNGTVLISPGPARPRVKAIAGGVQHSLAVMTDGTVWAWGLNGYGQLGTATTSQSEGVRVPGLTGVVTVAAGAYHSLAVDKNGNIWSWGQDTFGQLGDGAKADRLSPVEVPGLGGIEDAAAGLAHSLALRADGTVWSWGGNYAGQLGDGTTVNKLGPVKVLGLTNVVAIAAGRNHSMALRSDGTVWAWGDNGQGQLGNGTTTSSSIPVQVSGLVTATSIGAGAFHSLAVLGDGTVRAWGLNTGGQLGNGGVTNSLTPVTVCALSGCGRALSGVKTVVGGYMHTVALSVDQTILAWGDNTFGQLGNNTKMASPIPVQVTATAGGTFTNAWAIAAGDLQSLSVGSGLTLWEWGHHPDPGDCETPMPIAEDKPNEVPTPEPKLQSGEDPPPATIDGFNLLLYRGGSSTDVNFTPRNPNDVSTALNPWPNNGLSTFDNPVEACSNNKVQGMPFALVAVIPELNLAQDPARPSHWFLQGYNFNRHVVWANTRQGLQQSPPTNPPDILTVHLKRIISISNLPC